MKPIEPPRIARRFLHVLVGGPEREYVLGDLAEAYRRRARAEDVVSARRWYRRQAIRAVPAFVRRAVAELASKGRSGGPWRGSGQDVRWAFRRLRHRPTYAVAAVGTLGLGLGAAAAVLIVADSVWFDPLPFTEPHNVVRVFEVDRTQSSTDPGTATSEDTRAVSPPLLVDLQGHEWQSFEAFAAISSATYEWFDGSETRRLSAVAASANITDLLGVRPIMGRAFSSEPGVREVLLTEPLWRAAFGGDRGVVGQIIALNEQSYQIVGVLPADLAYPRWADLWTPLHFAEGDLSEGMRGARYLDVVARVVSGTSHAAAAAELNAFVAGLGGAHPNHRGWGGTVVDVRAHLVRPYVPVITLLLSGAAVFLLIATINVAGLAAARRADEAHDVALRRALGASRWRVARQNLVEAGLVVLGGAVLATALAIWVLAPVQRLAPADIPRLSGAGFDGTALGFLLAASVVVAGVIAIVGQVMARSSRSVFIGRTRADLVTGSRGRSGLTVAQIALTTVLLLGSALIARHVQALASVDAGFEPGGVMVTSVVLPERRYPDAARRLTFYRGLIEGLEVRGLTVAVGTNPPISGSTMRFGYRPGGGDDEQHWGQYHTTSPAYFAVLGIPVLEGRPFTLDDDAHAAPVAIVSASLARQHFGDGAVGRTITVVGTQRTIVGVVGSTRHFGPDEEPPTELYVPLAQDPWAFAHVLVSSAGGVPPGVLREVALALDPQMTATALAPFGDLVSAWFAPLRFQLVIVGLFAVLGTLLAGVGVYALVAYVVASRTREIGIRVALGAAHGSVFGRVVGSGLLLSGIGVLIGTAAAVALQRVIQTLVAGVDTTDLVAYLVVAVGMVLVAAVACAVPARRAARVDPVVALRE